MLTAIATFMRWFFHGGQHVSDSTFEIAEPDELGVLSGSASKKCQKTAKVDIFTSSPG
jgi:hypothetical protein